MSDENLTKSQLYKKQFFSNQDIFFSKKPTYTYPQAKDTTAILSSIASKPSYSQVKLRYKTKLFLSKFLLQSHMHWILYAYYKHNTLKIATYNHIGQSELNMQKMTILNYCKKSKDFNFIENINIFRDEEFYKNHIKNYNNNVIFEPSFKERSYGIFDNYITDKKLVKIINNIRKDIYKLK